MMCHWRKQQVATPQCPTRALTTLAAWAILLLCIHLQPSNTLNVGWEYAVIIDAGSTGSRAHVFKYYGHKDSPWPSVELPDAVHRTSPGLSAYAFDPKTAANSLEPLIKFAKEKVPPDQVSTTPIQLMGTASLRSMPNDTSDKVLAAVRGVLAESGFKFQEEWVRVLGGKEEGLWGWVAINYATGALQGGVSLPVTTQAVLGRKDLPTNAAGRETSSSSSSEAPPLMGLLELGGGSMQITFTPKQDLPPGQAVQVSLPGVTQELYSHSFQGWGLQSVMARRHQQLAPGGAQGAAASRKGSKDPCLHKGYTSELGVEGTGDWGACLTAVRGLLPTASICSYAKYGGCSALGGDVWTPKLQGVMLGLDNYFYTGRLLGLPVGPEQGPVSLGEVEKAAGKMCGRPWQEVKAAYMRRTGGVGSEAYLAKVCFSSALITVLLRDGLHMEPSSRHLQLSNSVITPKGVPVEVNWALGALLVEVLETGKPLSASWQDKQQQQAAALLQGEGVGAKLVRVHAAAAAAVMGGGFSDGMAGGVASVFCLAMMALAVAASYARVGVIPGDRTLDGRGRYQKLNRSMMGLEEGNGESPVASYDGHEAVVVMQTGRRQQG